MAGVKRGCDDTNGGPNKFCRLSTFRVSDDSQSVSHTGNVAHMLTRDTINDVFSRPLAHTRRTAERYDKLLAFVAEDNEKFHKVHSAIIEASIETEQALSHAWSTIIAAQEQMVNVERQELLDAALSGTLWYRRGNILGKLVIAMNLQY